MAATSARARLSTRLARTPRLPRASIPQVLPSDLYRRCLASHLDVGEPTGRLFASLCLARRGQGNGPGSTLPNASAFPLAWEPRQLVPAPQACSGLCQSSSKRSTQPRPQSHQMSTTCAVSRPFANAPSLRQPRSSGPPLGRASARPTRVRTGGSHSAPQPAPTSSAADTRLPGCGRPTFADTFQPASHLRTRIRPCR